MAPTLDPTDPAVWKQVRRTVARASASSFHCAISSISPDGRPHVSPIGSVRLTEPGRGYYLDVYNVGLGRNLDHDPRLTVMAVDSSKLTWLRGFLEGRFPSPLGVRLVGTAGPKRPATAGEVERFRRAVRPVLLTPGGRTLFGGLERISARDLTFSSAIPIRAGAMTRGHWPMADPEREPAAVR